MKPPDWHMEPMRRSDLSEVLAIEQAVFPAPWPAEAFVPDPEAFWARAEVLRDRNRPGSGVRGYICYWVLEGEMEIQNIAVHPGDWRSGGGGHMMSAALEEAGRLGCRHAWLEVRPSNKAAIALYERWGFERVGLRRRYYENGESALIMRVTLRRPVRAPGRRSRGVSLKGPRTGC